jgi:alpha-D-ribose 1-methylphosphonate 5-triphosphate synthase subunit PhnG
MDGSRIAARQHWMGILARADGAELRNLSNTIIALPASEVVRAPEIGTVMLEGRAGGVGERFNLGDATVTRCVVRVGDHLGFSYGLGRDRAKAQLAAQLDALLQDDVWHDRILAAVVCPLERAQGEKRDLTSRKVAATKVEFFTMVRGDA